MLKMGFGSSSAERWTQRPATRKPAARLFRITEDKAVIQSLGFNKPPAWSAPRRDCKYDRARYHRHQSALPKTATIAIGDLQTSFTTLAPFAET